jgi:hypothetical protein
MALPSISAGTRVIGCACLLLIAVAASANSVGPQHPEPSARPSAAVGGGTQWKDLSPAQQEILKPLAADWNSMSASQKKKWLALGARYSTMTSDQQSRMQERMQDWAALTPEDRRAARESYSRAKKLEPEQRTAEWQQYQQLSEEEKQKLAERAQARKRVTTLPPAAQDKNRITPPPKSVLKQELQPVTPPVSR